jgi:2',3'-cyclic-nucleotide 2'-phosphodiesterase (5'-nucleotidase family)
VQYGQVLVLDGGGFFPETDRERDLAWFQMDAMKLVGIDVAGVGDRDLRFGMNYLRETARARKLDLVSANLIEKKTGKPLLSPWVVRKVGRVNVGIFGLISDQVDLGPSRDSLVVNDPVEAAKTTVAALRKKGATTVVLLSQLGKVPTEDLVTAVDGIDAVIVGRNTPMRQQGRVIKSTVASYVGEQGQAIGRTVLNLDAKGRVASGTSETFTLGPEVAEKAEIQEVMKAFEESHNARLRQLDKEEAAKGAARVLEESPDRYVGNDVCGRCHQAQLTQWKGTGHAKAWQTLVDAGKDTQPECISCHVVGLGKPGGFSSAGATPGFTNVGCESCHGMGTQHVAWPAQKAKVAEAACRGCHNAAQDPDFDFAKALAKVAH